jgi:hypothetical protein
MATRPSQEASNMPFGGQRSGRRSPLCRSTALRRSVQGEAIGGSERANEIECGLVAVVREEQGRVGGEAAPTPADGAAPEDGHWGEAHQDLLQDLLGDAGEAIPPHSRSRPVNFVRHGQFSPNSTASLRSPSTEMKEPLLCVGFVPQISSSLSASQRKMRGRLVRWMGGAMHATSGAAKAPLAAVVEGSGRRGPSGGVTAALVCGGRRGWQRG